jgi:tRNA nucleotidyltransferase (CCA-adding enzyme)
MDYKIKGIARSIMERLVASGHEAYLVGGAVRDRLLGLVPHDIDIATNAKPNEILRVFSSHRTNEVGKSFGVVLVDGIEVSTYRSDNYFGLDDKKVNIEYANSIKDDLARRDFTINAMALGLDGKLVDPFGGMEDLRKKAIRFVGDPAHRMQYCKRCGLLRIKLD